MLYANLQLLAIATTLTRTGLSVTVRLLCGLLQAPAALPIHPRAESLPARRVSVACETVLGPSDEKY